MIPAHAARTRPAELVSQRKTVPRKGLLQPVAIPSMRSCALATISSIMSHVSGSRQSSAKPK